MRGSRNEALADVEMFCKLTKDEYWCKVLKAECEALLGNKAEALRLVEEAMPLIETNHVPTPFWVYAFIGDKDGFFKWVNWAIERKVVDALLLGRDLRSSFPFFKAVREDPRCAEVLRKLNLSQ